MKSRFDAIRPWLLIPVVDAFVLAYLWAVGSYFFSALFWGHGAYLLIPWYWLALFALEGAAVWESFGTSMGQKIAGKRPRPKDGQVFGFPRRFLWWLGWHLFWPLLPMVFLGVRPPQELLSGFSLAPDPPGLRERWYKTSWGLVLLLLVVLTAGVTVLVTRVDPLALIQGAPKTAKFWREIVSPKGELLGLGAKLLLQTFFMAFIATVFATLVAAPLSFLAARNLMRGPLGRLVYTLVRATASFTRSIDAVVWAVIFAVWVGVGSFAGVLALWVHSIVDLIKLYSEQLESIDPGPIEAITATGANKLQVIRYAIIPQIINPFLSFTLYRWDINVRMATVVGLVGGGGIGWRLISYLRSTQFREAGTMTVLIVLLVWAIDYVSAKLREKLA